MKADCKDVIDTGDGVVVDMSFFNVPPVRLRYAETCNWPMVEVIAKQLDLTIEEALTKSLYMAARMVVRPGGDEGHFAWINEVAKEYHND